MAKQRKDVHKVQMTEGKRAIIQQLFQEYDIESAKDIQDALKDLLGGTIKEMMESEMDEHLGYSKSERSDSDNARNGYKSKTLNSSYGKLQIDVPQDRQSSFAPKVVKKRQKDISEIDNKIISMYAKGMTTRQTYAPTASQGSRRLWPQHFQRQSTSAVSYTWCATLLNT